MSCLHYNLGKKIGLFLLYSPSDRAAVMLLRLRPIAATATTVVLPRLSSCLSPLSCTSRTLLFPSPVRRLLRRQSLLSRRWNSSHRRGLTTRAQGIPDPFLDWYARILCTWLSWPEISGFGAGFLGPQLWNWVMIPGNYSLLVVGGKYSLFLVRFTIWEVSWIRMFFCLKLAVEFGLLIKTLQEVACTCDYGEPGEHYMERLITCFGLLFWDVNKALWSLAVWFRMETSLAFKTLRL